MRLIQQTINGVFTTLEQGNVSCRFNSKLISDFNTQMLSSSYWEEKGAVTGTAQGRGTTWFVTYNDNNKNQHDWVLRHYYRGGLIGKVNKDAYWYSGKENTRAAREFSLLQHMQSLDLPAPEPIAYRIVQHGLYYKADLLSGRIKHSQDLVEILSTRDLPSNIWFCIGRTIKRFHQQNIYHHDLNSHNILLNDKEQVFLIDFDRGELRKSGENSSWKEANMSRLHRSFVKELKQLPVFYFTEENWLSLMSGYQKT